MNRLSKESATWHEIGPDAEGQRIDNYLIRLLKGVPKSRVYRLLRNGEVRINSRRAGPDQRLQPGDRVRIPPVRVARVEKSEKSVPRLTVKLPVLYEDEALLVVDKPPGLAVHGGSGIAFGVIEHLRHARPDARFLELVHRLDRDTSGVLLLAKKRAALVALHGQIRTGTVQKYYLTLVRGAWRNARQKVALPLHKYTLPGGERRVIVSPEGAASTTIFRLQSRVGSYSLLEAELKTGRTHQIRVHLAHLGYPILGDEKYGDFALNKALAKLGLKRMFLHASRMVITHPLTGAPLALEAAMPADLDAFLHRIGDTSVAPV